MHTVHSLSLLIIHSLILLAIQHSKHPIDKNIESNHQTSEIVDKHNLGMDITILVITSLKLMLKPRVPGPGISGDIPGCPRPGGSVRSQSPRSKMSWDIPRHPRAGGSAWPEMMHWQADIP